jgi:hypothetical protein
MPHSVRGPWPSVIACCGRFEAVELPAGRALQGLMNGTRPLTEGTAWAGDMAMLLNNPSAGPLAETGARAECCRISRLSSRVRAVEAPGCGNRVRDPHSHDANIACARVPGFRVFRLRIFPRDEFGTVAPS